MLSRWACLIESDDAQHLLFVRRVISIVVEHLEQRRENVGSEVLGSDLAGECNRHAHLLKVGATRIAY